MIASVRQRMPALLTFVIKVKPNARVSVLACDAAGSWTAQLKAAPVDGKANDELIALVAGYFACPRSAVALKSGGGGRIKRVTVDRGR